MEERKILKIKFIFLWAGIFFILLIFISRLFYLQVYKYNFFKNKANEQIARIIKVPSHRGNIYDRNKQLLATAKQCYSVYAVPVLIKDKHNFARLVAAILEANADIIYNKINNQNYFIWLKRKCDKETMEKLASLKLKGIDFILEEKRIYPQDNIASQVLGFVGIDNQGLGGFEYYYDEFLTGAPGKVILDSDPRGKLLISGQKRVIQPSVDGGHIYSTIDEYLEYITYKFLKKGIAEQNAERGSAVVMNPNTGEIYAMVTYPDFNPNDWFDSLGTWRKNSTVVDIYEPGSVLKIFTVAAAIEEGLVCPNTVLNVPEELVIANRTIKEAHKRKPGDSSRKTVTDILTQSLNVGATMLGQKIGPERLYKYLKNFGFGAKTKIENPAESSGLLRKPQDWTEVDIGMISFGQGIGVTVVQLAVAVSAIANGGELVKPKLVDYLMDKDQTYIKGIPVIKNGRVLSKKTTDEVRKMMRVVVEEGTGRPARIKGYSIGGKTGTAQKANANQVGYSPDKYIASFVGFFPVEKPEVLILVIVDSPQKSIWGSLVAVPIFRNIAKATIDYLNIAPDIVAYNQEVATVNMGEDMRTGVGD